MTVLMPVSFLVPWPQIRRCCLLWPRRPPLPGPTCRGACATAAPTLCLKRRRSFEIAAFVWKQSWTVLSMVYLPSHRTRLEFPLSRLDDQAKKEPQCQVLRLSRSSIQGEVQTSEMITPRGGVATIKSNILTVKSPRIRFHWTGVRPATSGS